MTTHEEWREIKKNADAFMFKAYDPETVVVMNDHRMTLQQAQEAETMIRGEEAILADDQTQRAGIWAQLLEAAGVLQPEHSDLLERAGNYLER